MGLRRGSQGLKESNKCYLLFFFLKSLPSKHSMIKLRPSIILPFAFRQGLLKLSRIALSSLYNSRRPPTAASTS